MPSLDSPDTAPAQIPRRPLRLHPALIIMPTIALLLSGIMAWAQIGFGPAFAGRWAQGFVSCLVMLPLVLAFLGLLERGLLALFGQWPPVLLKCITALIAALVIESVLALVVTLVTGAGDAGFASAWWRAFSRALPVGVLIGLFMSFYMKPRMERMKQAAPAATA